MDEFQRTSSNMFMHKISLDEETLYFFSTSTIITIIISTVCTQLLDY